MFPIGRLESINLLWLSSLPFPLRRSSPDPGWTFPGGIHRQIARTSICRLPKVESGTGKLSSVLQEMTWLVAKPIPKQTQSSFRMYVRYPFKAEENYGHRFRSLVPPSSHRPCRRVRLEALSELDMEGTPVASEEVWARLTAVTSVQGQGRKCFCCASRKGCLSLIVPFADSKYQGVPTYITLHHCLKS